MDYDYERYYDILTTILKDAQPEQEDLVIGENISTMPEVKIIFDGFGDLETQDENGEYVYEEGGDTNMESYAIFIHKKAMDEGFEFPEHDMTPWALIHRTQDEVCIYAWYDMENDQWDILQLEDRIDTDSPMTAKDVMDILEHLYKKYYEQ